MTGGSGIATTSLGDEHPKGPSISSLVKLSDNLWQAHFYVSLVFKTWICLRCFLLLYHGKSASITSIWENICHFWSKSKTRNGEHLHLPNPPKNDYIVDYFRGAIVNWCDFHPGVRHLNHRRSSQLHWISSEEAETQLFWVTAVTMITKNAKV